jgi:hypothetical protein
MEEILYRKQKLQVKTIPKNTLLFRLTKTSQNDLRGVPIDASENRCITPNFNVFFHPNPFIGFYMYKEYLNDIGTIVNIYMLEKDIKVLMLIKPSKYSRLTNKTKRNFLKQCSDVPKGCMPKIGNSYDPCFSQTLIKKYPDVVGMITNAPGDHKLLRKAIKKGIPRKTMRVINTQKVEDSMGYNGIPELILHPLTKRSSKQIIVHPDSKLENNYKLLKKMKFNEDELHKFMNKYTTYNPSTYFYMLNSNYYNSAISTSSVTSSNKSSPSLNELDNNLSGSTSVLNRTE